jgi:hypothetical protein
MRFWLKPLVPLLLLLAAQQGAVVHELSHVPAAFRAAMQVQSGETAESACALCPAYAQAATPTFGHEHAIPVLVRAGLLRSPDHADAAVDAAVPSPRSRGPPRSS